jgi:hypothetical protein
MQIIGFNFTKILAERKERLEGRLEVKQNIDIKDVTKEKLPVSKDEALKINFTFIISYSETLAKIEFAGNVILMPTPEELKEFMKSWKENQIPEAHKIPIFNFIMSKCNIKALAFEDELSLPYHISTLPRFVPEEKK